MTATLLEVRSVTEQDTLYRFFCPELASRARPGQFVEVLVSDGTDPFLRRPISIFDCDGRAEFSLLVRTVGRGTELMTRWTAGTEVDVLGPLGHGFTWAEADDVCTLVAGGVGVATMGYLARALLDAGKRVRLLFSPLRQARLLEVFPCGDRVEMICAGSRAELPAALEKALTGASRCFSCGPEGMLESVARLSAAAGVPCQISMERRMACGIGLCLGCAVAVRAEGRLVYRKACKDGPVFAAEEVAFHEFP